MLLFFYDTPYIHTSLLVFILFSISLFVDNRISLHLTFPLFLLNVETTPKRDTFFVTSLSLQIALYLPLPGMGVIKSKMAAIAVLYTKFYDCKPCVCF